MIFSNRECFNYCVLCQKKLIIKINDEENQCYLRKCHHCKYTIHAHIPCEYYICRILVEEIKIVSYFHQNKTIVKNVSNSKVNHHPEEKILLELNHSTQPEDLPKLLEKVVNKYLILT